MMPQLRLKTAMRWLGSWRGTALLGLAAALVAFRSLLLFQPRRMVLDPVTSWFFETNETSPQLLYFLFAWVLWHRRKRIRAALGGTPQSVAGSFFLALSAALFCWAGYTAQLDLLVDSLLFGIIGAALLLGGVRLLEALAVPVALLWLVRPLPPVVAHQLHWLLQLVTAELSYLLISPFGALAFRSGDIIWVGERTFEVIETCSGLRIIQTMVLAALLYAELFSVRRIQTLAVVLAAPLIGFLVNGARVIGLTLNPWAEVDVVHSLQGMAMLVGGVLLLAGVDRAVQSLSLGWLEDPRTRVPTSGSQTLPGAGRTRAVAGLAVALALFSLWIDAPAPPDSRRWKIQKLPVTLASWESSSRKIDQVFMASVRFDERVRREYSRDGDLVQVFVGLNDRRHRHQSGLSPKTKLPGSGWEVSASEKRELDFLSHPVERIVVERELKRRLVYHWRFGDSSLSLEALRWLIAFDSNPRRPSESIVTLRVDTAIDFRGEAVAEKRLDDFMRLFGPALLDTASAP